MWQESWGLTTDPFVEGAGPFLGVAAHEAVLSEIGDALGNREARIELVGPRGVGKSRILRELGRRLRETGRDVVHLDDSSGGDEGDLLAELAAGLGRRIPATADRRTARRAFRDAIRLRQWLGMPAILLVDGADDDRPGSRLGRGGADAAFSLIRATGREDVEATSRVVTIPRLTRSEAARYVGGKLEAAGARATPFDEGALDALHAWTAGLPRALDRLAALVLRDTAGPFARRITAGDVEGRAAEGAIRLGLAAVGLDG